MSDAPELHDAADGQELPTTILLLGTDAAGKNHVARAWTRKMEESGQAPDLIEGWLSGEAEEPQADEDKSSLSHLAELTFLTVFPLIAWFLPIALRFLMRRDARRFRRDGRRRLVISHSALRILAFCYGAQGRGVDAMSPATRRAVQELQRSSGAKVLVLDVDHEVRRRRIEARVARDDSDPFDRYMLADPERSERIEACLVSIAVDLMDGHLIVNNQLSDDELWQELLAACGLGDVQ